MILIVFPYNTKQFHFLPNMNHQKKAEISIKNIANPILLQSINVIKQMNHTTLSKKLNVLIRCTIVNLVALGTVFAHLK